jgi:hypothetical protein
MVGRNKTVISPCFMIEAKRYQTQTKDVATLTKRIPEFEHGVEFGGHILQIGLGFAETNGRTSGGIVWGSKGGSASDGQGEWDQKLGHGYEMILLCLNCGG